MQSREELLFIPLVYLEHIRKCGGHVSLQSLMNTEELESFFRYKKVSIGVGTYMYVRNFD